MLVGVAIWSGEPDSMICCTEVGTLLGMIHRDRLIILESIREKLATRRKSLENM